MPLAKAVEFLVYHIEKARFVTERISDGRWTAIFGSPSQGFLRRRLRDVVGGALDS